MHTYWQGKRICDLFLEAHWLTCADSHFNVRRPAECTACYGDGKAKQGEQGEEKEKVADHAATFPLAMTISD
jgi:hypothetical protein